MSATAKIRDGAPVLCVVDSRRAIDYFTAQLGFRVNGSVGDGPAWASLGRDGVEVMIVCGNYPAPAADWAIYFFVDDADALYEELRGRGAEIVNTPMNKPYNNREFEVRLPDGRVVAFGGPIPPENQ